MIRSQEDLLAYLREQRATFAGALALFDAGKLHTRSGGEDTTDASRASIEAIIANIDTFLADRT